MPCALPQVKQELMPTFSIPICVDHSGSEPVLLFGLNWGYVLEVAEGIPMGLEYVNGTVYGESESKCELQENRRERPGMFRF